MWAITCYFNPMGYQRRRENYRIFRTCLTVPLLTIEWNLDGNYELSDSDADRVVRVSGGDWMWQKERLLNIALAHLPADCREVAWLDCDVVFENSHWETAAKRLMRDYPLVQLYDTVVHASEMQSRLEPMLRPGEIGAGLYQRTGIVAASARFGGDCRALGASLLGTPVGGGPGDLSPGFAWAATREFLHQFPLLDTWIGGGGDSAYFWAAAGYPQYVVEAHALSQARIAAYLATSSAMSLEVKGRIGFTQGRILSLWHGSLDNRQYSSRHRALRTLGYEPAADLCASSSGVWSWTHPQSRLAPWMMKFFSDRRDDG